MYIVIALEHRESSYKGASLEWANWQLIRLFQTLLPTMFFSQKLLCCVGLLTLGCSVASAAHSFAGSNLYYAAGLYASDRTTLLE